MSVLGHGGGLPQPKRPKLDSATDDASEILGNLDDDLSSTAAQPLPPCSPQLPGSQPQTATQPSGLSPLRLSNIATNQPLTPPQRPPQQRQQDVTGQPAPQSRSTTLPNPPDPGGQTPDPEKRRLIQQQLVLLLHAHKCQRREEREQSVSGEYRPCTLPHCRTMKDVLNHMRKCQAGRSCTYPHCASSRQIISHWKNCLRSDCPVCQPLKHPAADRPTQQEGDPSNSNQLPLTMGGRGEGGGMLVPGVNQKLAVMGPGRPGMLSTLPTTPQYNQVGPPSMAAGGNMRPGGYFDQFNQPPSTTGMSANLAQSRTSYPVPIPTIASSPTQQWYQHVNPDLRQHLVRKLVEAIYPVQDPMALQDKRVASVIQYAMKVEKASFETATSRAEYYQLLAEKIYRIRKELEERRKVKNEMEKISRMRQGEPSPKDCGHDRLCRCWQLKA